MKRGNLSREEVQRALSLVRFLEQRNEAYDFLHPVDYVGLGLLDYPKIIQVPMDLSTVRRKVNEGRYSVFEEVLNDLMLIWDNCRTYNPPNSYIYNQANAMERQLLRYCTEHGIYIDNPNKKSKDPNADAVPYDEKLEFSEDLKGLTPQQLLRVVTEIEKLCPKAVKNLAEERSELKVDAIDRESFYAVWDIVKAMAGPEEET